MDKNRKKYSSKFKEDAVKLIPEQGYKITEAARNLGVNATMLGRWKRELEGSGEDAPGIQGGAAMKAELSRLQKENKRLKMEREILKKAYPVALICIVMQISRSGSYAWRKCEKSPRQRENDCLIPIVQAAHKKSKGTYGARRIAEEIVACGSPCGRYKAGTLMKLAGVAAKQKKKYLPVAPNLLNRQFEVKEPDKVYVSDITYI
jgi:transposase-like protein